MAQKTRKEIEMEANKKFGKGASKEKFEWRRAQQAAAGLEQEKKKRGGVAGAYDRNKELVQAAVPALAGMFLPGSSAVMGALAGGLARGLDRPGKGGIGLDLGQAARGAMTGAALGQLGGAAGSKLGVAKLGAGAAPLPPMPAQGAGIESVGARTASAVAPPTTAPGVPLNPTAPPPPPTFTPSAAGQAASSRIAGMAGGMGAGAGAGAGAAGGAAGAAGGAGAGAAGGMSTFRQLATNPQVIAGVLGGVSNVMGQQAQRRVQEQQLAQQGSQFQQQFDVSEEERKRRQAEANRLASMFIPRG
jgi:hypothetical protein